MIHKERPQVYKFPHEQFQGTKKEINMDSDEFMEKVGMWTAYYRLFPHLLSKDYIGIKLRFFQSFLIYMIMISTYFTFIAVRGIGKTFLTAIYAIIRAILYPGSLIVIASSTKTQALEMFLKIEQIYNDSPNVRREASKPTTSDNMPRMEFRNGSMIRVVASTENARGGRANVLILDESARMDSRIIASVLRKFKAVPRQPKFLSKDEYAQMEAKELEKYIEPNQEISLSSACLKIEPLWATFTDHVKKMGERKPYFACGLPYQMSVKSHLKTRQEVLDEMESVEFNAIEWSMEMDALFYGSTSGGFFSLNDFAKARILPYPLYPKWSYDLIDDKRFKWREKKEDEIRLLSVDPALSNRDSSDNLSLTVMELVPKGNRYIRKFSFMTSANGLHTDDLNLLIRRTFYDFDCDYLVLDIQTLGLAVYDNLTSTTDDPERGTFYEPWVSINDEKMKERAKDSNAVPKIYTINANDTLNTQIAINFKDHLQRGLIQMPVEKQNGRENLMQLNHYNRLSPENQAMFEAQYGQFNSLVSEMVNLKHERNERSATFRFYAGKGNKKDRYSSASYGNYVADILERDLQTNKGSWDDYTLW